MKSIQFNRLCRALALPVMLLAFSANAQSLVISNTAPTAIPRRASIILIVADGLGYGDLSCYGQTNFQTPNLDRLATEGVRFTNYSVEHENAKTEMAIMLGRNSSGWHQNKNGEYFVDENDITVAQTLRQSGYRTGLIGDWNLGDENSSGAPWKKGFDEFAGYLDPKDAENFFANYIFRYDPHTVLDTNDGPHFIGHEMVYDNTAGKHGAYIPDFLTKCAVNFVQKNQPDSFNHYRPFFLLLNYKIPGDGNYQVPTDAPFSEEKWPQPEKYKAAMIARLDGYIGQLQEQLQKLGLTNNTAIFFTSDTISKKSSGMDPEFFHSNISTNDLRVPMIIHWPDGMPTGRVSDFKWSAKDFLPTAAEIAFTKPPPNIDGKSVLPALAGKRW